MVGTEEGDLTKEQAHALAEHIWNDETKREFVLKVSATISGRHDGLKNDQEQYPKLRDLGLSGISTPTLLVHGTADSDVHPDQSEHALEQLPTPTSSGSPTARTCASGPIRRVMTSRLGSSTT